MTNLPYRQIKALAINFSDTEKALQAIWNTEGNYKFHVRDFVKWVKRVHRTFNFKTVREYVIQLNNSDYKPNTIRLKRSALKSAIRKLADGQDIETTLKIDRLLKKLDQDTETKPIKLQDPLSGFDKYLTVEEVNTLITNARSDRQRGFIEFLYVSGCRILEALNVKLKDLIPVNGDYVFTVQGKGKKYRELIVERKRIDKIKKIFDSQEYLFETSTHRKYNRSYVSCQISKLSKYVLGKKISAHGLRHSNATGLLESGAGVVEVSEWLGHSSLDITRRYLHKKLNSVQVKNFTKDLIT